MTPYDCPNCDEATIPFWQKQFLGYGRSVRCSNCGAKISVSLKTGLADMLLTLVHYLVILFVGLAVWDHFGIWAAALAIVLVSIPFFAISAVVRHRFVRLVVRDA